jgi:hypothetical protein
MITNKQTWSASDLNLYILEIPEADRDYLFLLLYVDDLLIACQCRIQVNRVKKLVSEKYRMTDLGPARQFLTIGIHRSLSGDIHLSQKRCIDTIRQRFQKQNCNGVAKPMQSGIQLRRYDAQNEDSDKPDPDIQQLYPSLVRSLMYLMTATRPDLAYTVSTLIKFSSAPTSENFSTAKRVLQYLKQTRNLGLTYRHGSNTELIGYSDSDHAGD